VPAALHASVLLCLSVLDAVMGVARLEALTTTTPRADAPSGTITVRDGHDV